MDIKPTEFIEPNVSPIRNPVHDMSGFARFHHWRTHKRHWRFNTDWIVWVDELKMWVKIPAGFVTDGASVPKQLHSLMGTVDTLLYGAIIHDFIYRFNQLIVCTDDEFGNWGLMGAIGKKRADHIMKSVIVQIEGYELPPTLAKGVLSVTGWKAWNKKRKVGFKLTTTHPKVDNTQLNYYT